MTECICTLTGELFTISDADKAFYEKISPVFAGKKYAIPLPTLCPSARRQRRMSWRNERSLYKRSNDSTQKIIVSIYAPDSPCTVFTTADWWSDNWDPRDYGKTIDFTRPFFDQWIELYHSVPHPALHVLSNENCEYVNQCGYSKNCYMSFNTDWCEDCYYCKNTIRSRDCMDLLNADECELCMESTDISNCYQVFASSNCKNTRNSFFCSNLIGCSDCFGCINVQNAQYCFLNTQYTRQEYEKKIASLHLSSYVSFQKQQKIVHDFFRTQPHRCLEQLQCENSTGDMLRNCKNVQECYDCFDAQDIAHCTVASRCRDIQDYDIGAYDTELSYEMISSGHKDYHTLFGINHWGENRDVLYSELMIACHDCFGCVGMRHKNYCILNKQYSKQNYENLAGKLIEHMQSTGEWGQFFPMQASPFAYDTTVANEYYPYTKEQARKYGLKYQGIQDEPPKVEKIISAQSLPDVLSDTPDEILNWAVECAVSRRPFRLTKKELGLLRKFEVPIPRLHPDKRYRIRLKNRNPRVLYTRSCMKCKKDIQTSYAPDREETVLCEQCYLREVY